MSRQGKLDLDALFDLEAQTAEVKDVPIAPAAASDLAIEGLSVWGTIARVVEVRPGVAWVDASSWSGYVVDATTQAKLPAAALGARLGRSAEVEAGWWREGAAAGIVAGTWPEDCVRALARADRLTPARAAEQLRRDVVAGARAIGLDTRALQEAVARWDRATITDVEEIPGEPQRRAGAVGSERGLSGGTDGAAAAGAGRELADMGGPEGPVETSGAGDRSRSGTAGDTSQPPRSDFVDLPGSGEGPATGEVLDTSGPAVGGSAGGRSTDENPRAGRDVASGGPDAQPAGAVRGERPGLGSEAVGDDDRSPRRDDQTARDSGPERRGADDSAPADAAGTDGDGATVASAAGPALMRPVASTQGEDYRPDGLTVPSGAKARFASNLAALGVLRRLEDEDRAAGPAEQEALAAWSGWGALPDAFSGANGWAEEAEQLRQSLTSEEYAAARANTLNAHYTDPAIVGAMWSALEEAGATQEATLLEPGSGSGNFMGQAPEGVRMIGVELDPLTARLSHYLYPSAQVRNEGFEQTVVRDGMVDGAVGNVPYGSFTLHDPMHNGAQLAIHNHFIVKALDATRAGGLVAVVTSGWTMDSQGTKARTEISKRGQLVAGVRLPTDSFSRVAGTKVNTDILVFQKHNEQVAVPNLETLEWGHTVEQGDVIVNKFFAEHPERVAGTVSTRTGRFGPVIEVTGASGGELGEQAGKMLTDQMRARGVRVPQRPGPLALRDAEALPGLFERLPDHERPEVGKIMYAAAVNGLEVSTPFVAWNGLDWAEVKVARPRVAETRALLDVRDRVASTLAAQSSPTSTTADREQTRARLNRAYTEYADKFGPINRFTLKERHPSASVIEKAVEASEREWRKALPEWMESSQRQAETPSEELRAEWEQSAIDDLTVLQKQQPHLTPLRTDPGLGSMLGLEIFDEETQEARKSQIFERDIITGAVQERHATTVDEAVAFGRADGMTAHSVETSRRKANTAASTRKPSADVPGELAPALENGTGTLLTRIAGGVPLVFDQLTVGGLGVAGGPPAQDAEVAAAVLKALAGEDFR